MNTTTLLLSVLFTVRPAFTAPDTAPLVVEAATCAQAEGAMTPEDRPVDAENDACPEKDDPVRLETASAGNVVTPTDSVMYLLEDGPVFRPAHDRSAPFVAM